MPLASFYVSIFSGVRTLSTYIIYIRYILYIIKLGKCWWNYTQSKQKGCDKN